MNGQKDEKLYALMQMIIAGGNGVGFFKGAAIRECEGFLKDLGYENGQLSENAKEDVKKLASKYIKISLDSPTYGSVLGLIRPSKDSGKKKLCTDIRSGLVTYLISLGKEKESKELLSIFREAYVEDVENGEEMWRVYFSR